MARLNLFGHSGCRQGLELDLFAVLELLFLQFLMAVVGEVEQPFLTLSCIK